MATVKITFNTDFEGTVDEAQAFLETVGFRVRTSLTQAEQDAIAVSENAEADRLQAIKQQLTEIGTLKPI